MSLPRMTFSLRPSSGSDLAWVAASVSTRVVSWKDAADSHDSVASEALVMPMSSGRPEAVRPPSRDTRSHSRPGRGHTVRIVAIIAMSSCSRLWQWTTYRPA